MGTTSALVESLIRTYGNTGGADGLSPCQIQAIVLPATSFADTDRPPPFDMLVDLYPPTPATLVMKGDFNGGEIMGVFSNWLCF
jgi:hypothetical protein